MAAVELRQVVKTYDGKHTIIHGLDLDIREGEFCVFVGPSGCGKSTLLRMLAGLEEISGGEILIDAKVVNDLESKDRDIAMVFQSYALYPHMTVGENMGFSLRLRKADAKTTTERVAIAARICTRSFASRFDSGSSIRNACGSRTIARPIATRWRCPPESARGLRLRNSSIWRIFAARCTRSSISRFGVFRSLRPNARLS